MLLAPDNLQALWLTFKVAALTTLILLLAGTPLAWWLARSRAWVTRPIGALVALPLVLPPSVLGFYLLVALGPEGPLGRWMLALGLPTLPFTFAGLVVASVFYSLPFMVQPTSQPCHHHPGQPHTHQQAGQFNQHRRGRKGPQPLAYVIQQKVACIHRHQRFHSGVRFSANARAPSWAAASIMLQAMVWPASW